MKHWKHIAIGVAAVAWTIGTTNAQDDNFETMVFKVDLSIQLPTAPAAAHEAWKDNRFGMFIHWGPISQKGLQLSHSRNSPSHRTGGKPYKVAPIEPDVYDVQYRTFNPEKFDPDSMLKLARRAGVSYIVFTAKHHAGFSMFDSAVTDYDIMNTPYKKDIFRWPNQGGLRFPGLEGLQLKDACLLSGGEVSVATTDDGFIVDVPAAGREKIVTTVELIFDGETRTVPPLPRTASLMTAATLTASHNEEELKNLIDQDTSTEWDAKLKKGEKEIWVEASFEAPVNIACFNIGRGDAWSPKHDVELQVPDGADGWNTVSPKNLKLKWETMNFLDSPVATDRIRLRITGTTSFVFAEFELFETLTDEENTVEGPHADLSNPEDRGTAYYMMDHGWLSDVLSADDKYIYMRNAQFDHHLRKQETPQQSRFNLGNIQMGEHVFSTGSMLDDSLLEINDKTEVRMVRSSRYKYIVYAKGELREQLFDLDSDPGETTNLIQRPEMKKIVEAHRSMLREWMKQTDDTFTLAL